MKRISQMTDKTLIRRAETLKENIDELDNCKETDIEVESLSHELGKVESEMQKRCEKYWTLIEYHTGGCQP
jgi:uncharacterized protein Yka (UPF0111/DUF47 family)